MGLCIQVSAQNAKSTSGLPVRQTNSVKPVQNADPNAAATANAARTAELQKQNAALVEKQARVQHAQLTPSKSNVQAQKTEARPAAVAPVKTAAQPTVNTNQPRRDEAAATAFNDKVRAQKMQNASQPVAPKKVAVTQATGPGLGNSKVTSATSVNQSGETKTATATTPKNSSVADRRLAQANAPHPVKGQGQKAPVTKTVTPVQKPSSAGLAKSSK